jgi:hypothetical protein
VRAGAVRVELGLAVGRLGDGSRDGFGDAVFDDVAECNVRLADGMDVIDGCRLNVVVLEPRLFVTVVASD